MPSHSPALELENVCHAAGETSILRDISWKVERGEHWAVLGPNGAGKTTLLRIACGYLWPNRGGVVRRDGSDHIDLREIRKSIGWVSSVVNVDIPRHEQVLRTVVSGKFAMLGLRELDWDRPSPEDFDLARGYLEQLGAADLTEKRFGVLSQGEQQKVLIARARMTEPLLILLDEPCAGLDPAAREHFLATVEALADTPGAPSLVMSTHHFEEIMLAFSNTLLLVDGKVAAVGATPDVITRESIQRAYGTAPAQLVKHSGRIWPIW
ncbi:MAG: ATP-binding cassette domain-containing protein [Pirellulales bacterium]|nr:ATP-binding cassette domain-containing protein [Pirellulales bacterium]